MSLSRIKTWAERMEKARIARDVSIRDAHASGKTMRQIAEAAQLTPGRVHQIIHQRPAS